MQRISLDTSVAKETNHIIDRVVDGEVLLIDLRSGDYFSLNATGATVWQHIDGTKTIDDLVKIVLAEYDTDPDQVVADVLRLVNDLANEGLVVSR